MLLEIYFESDQEVIGFCEHVFRYNKQVELHWKTHKDWGNQLQLEEKLAKKEFIEVVAKSMVDVFIAHRLGSMIKHIIKDFYYFTNTDELERIMDLTYWILTGDDSDSLFVRKDKDPKLLLQSLFIANIKNTTTVHYDSIVKFRLKVFRDQLIHYVGLAIDEFKREEDHQTFINMLREYIAKKEPGFNMIHILQDSTFTFFKQSGKQFTKMELRKLIQKEPLYSVGLDESEFNLAPLVAMAPRKIKIYGDHPAEPKTLTVINIFQEKVDFEPYNHFPFPTYLNNR